VLEEELELEELEEELVELVVGAAEDEELDSVEVAADLISVQDVDEATVGAQTLPDGQGVTAALAAATRSARTQIPDCVCILCVLCVCAFAFELM
jgi:hypothetical protein